MAQSHPHGISDESLPYFHGNQVTVGTAAVQLDLIGYEVRKSIKIKALAANTGKVYVGRPGVTTGRGYELSAGEELELKVDDLRNVWLIASAASQVVCWISV
jgi:hypothetical protein